MYAITFSKRILKSLRKLRASGKFDEKLLLPVLNIIASGDSLDLKYKNHWLGGKYKDFQECHLKSDLLLIYQIAKKEGELRLFDIGSHSELFK